MGEPVGAEGGAAVAMLVEEESKCASNEEEEEAREATGERADALLRYKNMN